MNTQEYQQAIETMQANEQVYKQRSKLCGDVGGLTYKANQVSGDTILAKTEPRPAIIEQIHMLESNLANLSQTVTGLEERLAPIVSTELPTDQCEQKALPSNDSGVCKALRGLNESVCQSNIRLRRLMERLQV